MLATTIRPFDTSCSSLTTREVPVHKIVDILHVTHAPERIEEYRRAMLSGTSFPPISVFPIAGRFIITDGHKRFAACRAIEIAALAVELWRARELFEDQLAQLLHNLRKWRLAISTIHNGTEARRQGMDLLVPILLHWRRVALSLWGLVVKPLHPATGDVQGDSSITQTRRPG